MQHIPPAWARSGTAGRVRLLAGCALAAALASAPALAQGTGEQVPEPPADATAPGAETQVAQEIIVTGSRIARPDLQASSPVTIVSEADVQLSGNTNVEQFLNELPQVAPSAAATTNNGTEGGIATIDLRGLGANRTLVLVNGRRMVASNNLGWVDLNNIPAPLIERVDIVTGGASAIYGSDAIAGVVNFILKEDFEGLELGAQYSITDRGDASIFEANATMGGNFANGRGNVVLYTSYAVRDDLRQGERDFSEVALGDVGDGLVPLGSSRIAGGTILVPSVLPDGTAVDSVKFTPGGIPIDRADETYNFAPENFLQTPQERWLITALGNYEITDGISGYVELLYANNRIDQQLAADANDIPDPPGSLQVTLANPLFDPTLREYFRTNFDEDGDGIATIPAFRRRMTENGPRQVNFEHDVYRILGGLRGELGIRNLRWDAYYSFARSNRSEELGSYTSDVRIQQALLLEPDPANPGQFRCTSETARAQGCIPISLFGEGQLSPEGADFIAPDASVVRDTQQDIAALSLSGDIFDLPAGGVGVAVGYEYRREASDNSPDALVQSGELGPGSSERPTGGSFNVNEVFGEVVIPILRDRPFFERLEIEGAIRYSDYSTVGGITTWKAGGQWEPGAGLRFRGLYQRAVRAPNIYELFQGRAVGADDFDDPCAARNDPSAALQQFCIAQGVPASILPTFEGDPASQANTVFGGNPELNEEESDTYTLGLVFQPEFARGLALTVDYYRIDLQGAIDDLDAATTSNLCYQDPSLTNPFCQAITRDPSNGIVSEILAGRANLAEEKREGIDWQLTYAVPLPGSLGLFDGEARLQIQHVGNYTLTNEYVPVEGEDTIDCNGFFGAGCTGLGDFAQPKFRTTSALTYLSGPLTLRTQLRHLGKLRNNDPTDFVQEADRQFYLDLAASFEATRMLNLTLGVDNLLDNDPPILADSGPDANTDASLYDVFGRRFFVAGRLRF